jgi:hypothetical protein
VVLASRALAHGLGDFDPLQQAFLVNELDRSSAMTRIVQISSSLPLNTAYPTGLSSPEFHLHDAMQMKESTNDGAK